MIHDESIIGHMAIYVGNRPPPGILMANWCRCDKFRLSVRAIQKRHLSALIEPFERKAQGKATLLGIITSSRSYLYYVIDAALLPGRSIAFQDRTCDKFISNKICSDSP